MPSFYLLFLELKKCFVFNRFKWILIWRTRSAHHATYNKDRTSVANSSASVISACPAGIGNTTLILWRATVPWWGPRETHKSTDLGTFPTQICVSTTKPRYDSIGDPFPAPRNPLDHNFCFTRLQKSHSFVKLFFEFEFDNGVERSKFRSFVNPSFSSSLNLN